MKEGLKYQTDAGKCQAIEPHFEHLVVNGANGIVLQYLVLTIETELESVECTILRMYAVKYFCFKSFSRANKANVLSKKVRYLMSSPTY